MKYLIVSGGEVKEGFLTWIVKNGGFDVILAADAGMEALYRDHILPDIIVGDFDSVNPDTLEYFHDKEQIEVCMLNPEKDDTDTEYAIREAIRRGAMEIVVIGATGTRIDHVLGNISLLMEYQQMGLEVVMLTDYGFFTPAADTQTFAGFPHQQVSVFNFDAVQLRSEGLKYPIYDFRYWWQGTLNEVEGDSFRIMAKGHYLVYRTYEAKG